MHVSKRLFPVVLALLAPLAPASARALAPALQAAAAGSPPAAERKGEALLERVVVVGASLSSGQGLGDDAKKARLTFARIVDAAIVAKHEPVADASDLMTFLDPQAASKRALAKLEKRDPTLVVALDYLFWFGYGTSWGGEKERLAALELGLKSLEGLHCPVLLGDFPDMRSALKAATPVLPAAAVPEPATLEQLNARLAAWAKQHPNVILVPVAGLMRELLAGEEMRVGPNLWPKGKVSELLQSDGLHPTLEGATGLWLVAAECLLATRKDLPGEALEPKAGTIVGKLAPERKLLVLDVPIQEKRGKSAPAKVVH